MLRPHDLWTIADAHDPGRPVRPDGGLELTMPSRAPLLRGRRRLATAALVPVLALVAACGSNDPGTSAYCGAIEDAKPSFTALQSGDPETFEKAFAELHELAQDSPADLDRDWQALDEAITGVRAALGAAGLDFSTVAAGDLPGGVDPTELQAVTDALEALTTPAVQNAADRIEEHAFEACDVELAAG